LAELTVCGEGATKRKLKLKPERENALWLTASRGRGLAPRSAALRTRDSDIISEII
jgi:hypothetical protein